MYIQEREWLQMNFIIEVFDDEKKECELIFHIIFETLYSSGN